MQPTLAIWVGPERACESGVLMTFKSAALPKTTLAQELMTIHVSIDNRTEVALYALAWQLEKQEAWEMRNDLLLLASELDCMY